MAEEKICSSCGSDLIKGFLFVRNNENPNFFNRVVWAEGDKNKFIDYMRSANTPQFPVTSYKCPNCGHIEFYADTAEPWK